MKKVRVGAVIQARMGSTRLAGKVIKPIGDYTLIEHIIKRLKRCQTLDDIIIATTLDPQDDILEKVAYQYGVQCFRGSKENVLNRFINAANEYHLDSVLRICADSPFVDPYFIDLIVKHFENLKQKNQGALLTVDYHKTRLLDGIEITSLETLKEMDKKSQKEPKYQEHVTLYLKEKEPDRVFYFDVPKPYERTDLLINIDTQEDFDQVKSLYDQVLQKGGNPLFSITELISIIPKKD